MQRFQRCCTQGVVMLASLSSLTMIAACSAQPANPARRSDSAVVVAGLFTWGVNAGATISMSYTAFLRRQDGVLRIQGR